MNGGIRYKFVNIGVNRGEVIIVPRRDNRILLENTDQISAECIAK